MKDFNDGHRFSKIIQNYIKLGIVRPNHHIYNKNVLGTNLGLYTALTTSLTEVMHSLDSVKDYGTEIESCDERDAQKSLIKFKQIMNSTAFQELQKDENTLQTRNELFNALKNSKYLFYKISDKPNPAYANTKYFPYILINNNTKTYINLDNRNLTGHQYNCNQLTDKEIKAIVKKNGHRIGKDFQIKENPNASDDIDMPRVLSINGIRFFYNPKKVKPKNIIYANVPNLSNDQDSYDALNYNKKMHSLYIE